MEAFITRKKRKRDADRDPETSGGEEEEEPTEVKLALLSSVNPNLDQDALLDILLAHDGSVSAASASLKPQCAPKKPGGVIGSQTSLRFFSSDGQSAPPAKARLLSKKGATLHLYDPADIAEHTPCTIIHNFLPPDEAGSLLTELLEESKTFEKMTFKLFDNVVSSPHTTSLYVSSNEELNRQKYEYVYNGSRLTDVRKLTPQLDHVKVRVEEAVNHAIQERMKTHNPGGTKLKHQSPLRWSPNAAFVNCYAGPQESVGWHSDQLTYVGPRPVIGSLSLGVAREFRVRRVLPRDADGSSSSSSSTRDASAGDDADAAGQIAIHLPHNSLLVMHAEMQEEWKHSIAPAQVIDPHPLAGNKRINVTYRDYRPEFHPDHTPKCGCGVPTVLRVVQRKRENLGRYFWMCHAGNVPGKDGCPFFRWAEFDDDGNPIRETSSSKPVSNKIDT